MTCLKKNTDFKSTRMLAIYDELLHGKTLDSCSAAFFTPIL